MHRIRELGSREPLQLLLHHTAAEVENDRVHPIDEGPDLNVRRIDASELPVEPRAHGRDQVAFGARRSAKACDIQLDAVGNSRGCHGTTLKN